MEGQRTIRRKEMIKQVLNNKELVVFKKTIPAGTTETLHSRIKDDATIEEMQVRFYSGQVGTLHVRPFIEARGNKVRPLYSTTTTGENFLSGDDDLFVFRISEPVQYDDFIKVTVTNNGDYDYTLLVIFTVDYFRGKERV